MMTFETGPIAVLVFGLMFFTLALLFIRRSKQKRREMFADSPTLTKLADESRDALNTDSLAQEALAEVEQPGDAEKQLDTDLGLEEGQEEDLSSSPEELEPPELQATNQELEGDASIKVDAPQWMPDQALQKGLAKTKIGLLTRLTELVKTKSPLDARVLDELEDAMLMADMGVKFTMALMDDIREAHRNHELRDAQDVEERLKAKISGALEKQSLAASPLGVTEKKPRVIIFVGVNGVGKTTTIGKIATIFKGQGRQVVLAAGDTFRAAASEQLAVWAERSEAQLIKGESGADPASVIFNAVQHACQNGADVVLADTAGRLHTKSELMDEIKKIKRAAGKARSGAPDDIWLVVDGTTGQNALLQAKEFDQALGLTGVILTKLDGTAKGGVIVAISDTLNLPIRFVGVGEKAEDLRPFDRRTFVEALFSKA
jgi:fused signal recognition particle receptor